MYNRISRLRTRRDCHVDRGVCANQWKAFTANKLHNFAYRKLSLFGVYDALKKKKHCWLFLCGQRCTPVPCIPARKGQQGTGVTSWQNLKIPPHLNIAIECWNSFAIYWLNKSFGVAVQWTFVRLPNIWYCLVILLNNDVLTATDTLFRTWPQEVRRCKLVILSNLFCK